MNTSTSFAHGSLVAILIMLLASTAPVVSGEGGVDCVAACNGADNMCTYTAKVNLHAGELGYFQFEECGDIVNPTLGVEVGKTYRFLQSDRTNYFHPLGFAYFPDGAHDDKDELEPSIVPPGSASTCNVTETCPAPKYYQDGVYLGDWMHDDSSVTSTGDFGLDHYEPKFFYPLGDWLGFGAFETQVTFDVADFNQDFFYFCHIHQFMTGRIKLVDSNGDVLVTENVPEMEYDYDVIQSFDQTCGTFNTSDFQLPLGKFKDQCPERFVCEVAESRTLQMSGPSDLEVFAECMDAMNCAMMVGMTTHATSSIGLFVHQMIPHHQNAVNMAKALLKTGGLTACDDLTNEDDPTCIMEAMMYEIINGQNAQIQTMRAVLQSLDEPAYADCAVPFGDGDANREDGGSNNGQGSGAIHLGINLALIVGAFAMPTLMF